jgi:hypothetical protein
MLLPLRGGMAKSATSKLALRVSMATDAEITYAIGPRTDPGAFRVTRMPLRFSPERRGDTVGEFGVITRSPAHPRPGLSSREFVSDTVCLQE